MGSRDFDESLMNVQGDEQKVKYELHRQQPGSTRLMEQGGGQGHEQRVKYWCLPSWGIL